MWVFFPKGAGDTVYNSSHMYRLSLEGFPRKLSTGEGNKMAEVPGLRVRPFVPPEYFSRCKY